MRRNTVTLLKYIGIAALFLVFGPMTLRGLFGGPHHEIDPVHMQRHAPQGLPEAPEEMKHHFSHSKPVPPAIVLNVPHKLPVDSLINAQVDHLARPKGGGSETGVNNLIDWHDYERIASEAERTGPGEQGAAVILTAEEEKQKDALFKVNGFNAFASDKISLDRALKDIRHPDCKHQKHHERLSRASVIVPFHNEHWTTLLRTAQSVINRSPPELIEEVILVDDYSNKDFLKKDLDDYLAKHYNGKVKVVRAAKREGLIRTRLLGARAAKGDVLIFLDSHCEAAINWLPPLLDPIAEDYRAVVCPFIDVIDFETFAYRAQDEGARGAFDWEFFYKRLPLLPDDLKHPARPFKSPVMAGGLFAIHTKWFWELGGYDPGLDIWGGEQYELSFKLWQCGGIMLDAPCSRVGHVYRKFAPFPNPGVGDFVGRNYRRVAEVWMDEYAEFLYKRRPHYRSIDEGDLSEQRAIREKLHCKSFKWFMEEVAFDLPLHYPMVEPPNKAEGELRSVSSNMCVDTRFKGQNERFNVETCIKDQPGASGEQRFEMTWHRDVRPVKRTLCWDVSTSVPKAPVLLYQCHGQKGNQHFKYNAVAQQVFHPISHQCLDHDPGSKELFMNPCDSRAETQKWAWEKTNEEEIRKEWES